MAKMAGPLRSVDAGAADDGDWCTFAAICPCDRRTAPAALQKVFEARKALVATELGWPFFLKAFWHGGGATGPSRRPELSFVFPWAPSL